MLRQVLSANVRSIASQRRSFVSTVLLTRDWSTESHHVLKKEAKKRGLLQTGSKSTLITRLQEHERENATQNPPQPPQQPAVTQQVRHASTVETPSPAAPPAAEIPGIPSSSQPTPIPPSYPTEFLDVKIPETYLPIPEPPIAVPFVPDLWDSSKIKAESAPAPVTETSTPKVLAVAGTEQHPDGNLSHNLYSESSNPSTSAASAKRGPIVELLHDLFPVTASFQLPAREIPKEFLEGVAETTQTSGQTDSSHSRTLDSDEKTGVLALVGLLAGSWLLAGYLKPESAFVEKPHHEKAEHEKAAESH